ncbi:Uncharacterised protein [Streptococcus pneumoniae]|nr:Uncharacterised protein [Streptococcus pneumoniae]
MTNLLFVSYSSKISSNRVNVALPYVCYYLQPQQGFEQPAASFLVLIFI